MRIYSFFLSLWFISLLKVSRSKVLVAGATGYIGRAVVSELVSRGIPVGALLRQDIESVPSTTRSYLEGAEIITCDVLDKEALTECVMGYQPDTAICCLASRDGLGKNAWAIDYGGGSNLLQSLEALHADRIQKRALSQSDQVANKKPFALFNLQKDEVALPTPPHYVLLSAYCCGKPELQFQYAKLKLEEELLVSSLCTIDFDDEGNIINSQACINSYDNASPLMKAAVSEATLQPALSKKLPFPSTSKRNTAATTLPENGNYLGSSRSSAGGGITHSIVRPTAYFKSLDGQVEAVRQGNPILYFGDGTCSANAISENDLAVFLADCALRPSFMNMKNTIRNVGGPDIPPITKKQQAELIFDALGVPEHKRRSISLPLSIFDVLLNTFQAARKLCQIVGFENLAEKCENGAEIVRIIKYYAIEPMVALDVTKGEVQGSTKLIDHFKSIAETGKLKEVDKYTTTTGVLDMILQDDYVNT